MTAKVCSTCGRSGLVLKAGRCGTCTARSRRQPCGVCDRVRPVSTRTETGVALCDTCAKRRTAHRLMTELHRTAAATLRRWLPALDDNDDVVAAVGRAAPTFRQASWLVGALTEVAVLHGSTTAPPVIDRLVTELVAGGAVGIAAPRCVSCGRSDWLTQRIDGHRACVNCAHRVRAETCGRCGQWGRVTTRDSDGVAVCGVCFNKDRSRWETCGRCATLARPARRLDDGTSLCRACNRRTAICAECGLERPCDGVRTGRFRCEPCSRRKVHCSRCRRVATVAVVWASGPVCTTCHHKGLEARAACDGCGQVRRPDPRHPSGQCSDCVGLPAFSVCSGCGVEDRLYRNGHCWRCSLGDVFDTLTVNSSVDLTALRTSLLATDRPRAVVRWLTTAFAANSITSLATSEVALTHQGIDSLGDSLAVNRLRAELVMAGLIEPRDEMVARLETWIAGQVDAIADTSDRQTVDAFSTWHVLRRVRHRAATSAATNDRWARTRIARAVEFLTFLRSHGLVLATCTQADVELWLAGPPSRRAVRDFLRWAHRRGLCCELDIAKRTQGWPARRLTPGAHQQIIRRLLTDDTISLVDRVSGLLVGCYGQFPARLVRLTIDDITIDDATVTIRFGREPVTLAEPVAACVAALIATRRGRSASDATAASRWLFPGGFAGCHLDPETLANRLRQLGISSAKLRTDVLLDLAADIPPAIVADLIGLYPTTAARWPHAAGGDWAGYVAQRSDEDRRRGSTG